MVLIAKLSLGAIGKGRSSSISLNAVVRSLIGWLCLGGKTLNLFYLDTKDNPADDPSRSVAVRAPMRLPESLSRLLVPQRTEHRVGLKGPFGLD